MHALKIWRPYLLGQKVRVLTDHMPLGEYPETGDGPRSREHFVAIEFSKLFLISIEYQVQRTLLQRAFHGEVAC